MDAMVDDCEFEGLHICVDHVGRGLYLRRNIIALSDIGANFSWPDSGVEGTGLHRSEEHTSELQSLMRISYAVFCLKKKIRNKQEKTTNQRLTSNNTSEVTYLKLMLH